MTEIATGDFLYETFLFKYKMSIGVENDTKEGLLRWNKLSSDNQSVAWLYTGSRAHATVFPIGESDWPVARDTVATLIMEKSEKVQSAIEVRQLGWSGKLLQLYFRSHLFMKIKMI